jgi:hypothetical protein
MAQRGIRSLINIRVQERKVTVSFHHHGELNVLVDAVQVVEEVIWLVQFMGPDDKVLSA